MLNILLRFVYSHCCSVNTISMLLCRCVAVLDNKVCLISSSSGNHWIIPKGGWETNESAQEAAEREAVEEV